MPVFEPTARSGAAKVSGISESVLGIRAPLLSDPNKIHEALIFAKLALNLSEIRIAIAHNNCLCVLEDRLYAGHHQSRNVWNVVENEIPVGAYQSRDIHVSIVDP